MLLFVAATYGHAAQPPVPEGYTVGQPWTGERGVRLTTAQIMEHQARQADQRRPERIHHRATVELVERAEDLATPAPPDFTEPTPPALGSPQTFGVSFTGATLADTRAYPPDSMGAVGPSQYIVAVNGRIRSFDKTNGVADGILNADTDVFFNSVMTPPVTNNFTSDPRIRYDRLSGRWFIIMIDVPGQTGALANRVMLAVSDGPLVASTNSWTFFQFQHDLVGGSQNSDAGEFADYPTLGIDANALYIGVNIFKTRGTGSADNTTAFVVRKSPLLVTNNAPTNIVVTAFRGLIAGGMAGGPFTPQGVDNYDPNATEGYVIGAALSHTFYIFDRLMLRRISDPGGTPAISGNVAVPLATNYGLTINVPHLGNTNGTANYLDGLDFRLLGAHFRNGRLWTAQNLAVDNTGTAHGTTTSSDSRMGVRWYELQGIATGQTPGVRQMGTVFEPSSGNTTTNRSYWMGTVMVSGQGHAAMGLSAAGANEYANAAACGRLAGDATNTMRTPSLYTAASTPYNPRDRNGNPINRWGDYSYTCLDPDDDMTMWTIQEFCDNTNSYGVRVVKLLAPPPGTPVSCSPASAPQGAVNFSVVVTGTSSNGSGFFDPGAGFTGRLRASVNGGGVTVNSVTYTDPTHFTMNLNVAPGTTAGARTLTATNPDNQVVTSAAIFTITGVSAQANLGITKTVSQNPVQVGSNFSYTIIVTNLGPQFATSATVTDVLPGAVTFVSATPSQGTCTNSGGTLSCNLGPLASGAGATISVIATAITPGLVTNTATVAANELDPVPSNNSATATTLIRGDTDGDGIPDDWEEAHGLNPNDTTDAAKDFDGDGLTNLQEYLAGTDPNDSRNFLQIISVALSGTNAQVSFSSVTNKLYRVERSDDLSSGSWSTVSNNVPGTGASVMITDFGADTSTQRAYWVRLLP